MSAGSARPALGAGGGRLPGWVGGCIPCVDRRCLFAGSRATPPQVSDSRAPPLFLVMVWGESPRSGQSARVGSAKSCSEWRGAAGPGAEARADRARRLSQLPDRGLPPLRVRGVDGQAPGAELCAAARPPLCAFSALRGAGGAGHLPRVLTLRGGAVQTFHPATFSHQLRATAGRGARCFHTARCPGRSGYGESSSKVSSSFPASPCLSL